MELPMAFLFKTTRRSSHLIVPALVMLALVISACSKADEKKAPKPPVSVSTAVSERKTIPVMVRAIGSVEPYSTVAIKSQINGMIQKVHFTEGEDVKQGQLLFTIDRRPFEAALRQARAQQSRDAAQLRFAREQVRRYGELVKDGIVTKDQYEQLSANADALAESVAGGGAAVDNAAVQLSYCQIRSPISGRTGNLMVHGGNLVKANDNPVLVTINRINPIYVSFSVPEKELAEVRKYLAAGPLKATATIPNSGEPGEVGQLTFVDNTVDTATGTIKFKAIYANRNRKLWPGQFVNVALTLTTRPDAVVVPTPAVQTGQTGQYVFVVKSDGKVESRPVVAGDVYEGQAVILSGLTGGETVVTDGHLSLSPGARVAIRRPLAASGAKRP
jgi:multidrug efflux system membrane fusion protein